MGILGFNLDLTDQLAFYGRCALTLSCHCSALLQALWFQDQKFKQRRLSRVEVAAQPNEGMSACWCSYHRNKWNQLIHFFFVPLILWTVAVWACYTGPLVQGLKTPHFDSELLQLLGR